MSEPRADQSQCEELARYFLSPGWADAAADALVVELAGVIQAAIEGWFKDQETVGEKA